MTVAEEREKIAELLRERRGKARPRGRDVRKLPKPYLHREVVFTCSNGWTLERCPPEDHFVEGFMMGHCLGGPDARGCGNYTYLSLRESDGTPHVTVQETSRGLIPYGRCNRFPKSEYVRLIQEYAFPLGKNVVDDGCWLREIDDDREYHELGKLNDSDYRDREVGRQWRDQDWQRKRLTPASA